MNAALIEHGPGPCENTGSEPGPSLEFYDVTFPQTVAPGEQVTFEIEWNRCSDCNPNAVIYSSLLGDWAPANPLYVSDAYFTSCDETAVDSVTFQAPTQPGEYRLRWIMCFAFDAIRNFCGEHCETSADDPGYCPYVEVSFTVTNVPPEARVYDPHLGTLPAVQGFFETEWNGDSPAPYIDGDHLHQGPTSLTGYQYIGADSLPVDYSGSDFSVQIALKVLLAENAADHYIGGFVVESTDSSGAEFIVNFRSDAIWLYNGSQVSAVVPTDTTDGFHTYRLAISNGTAKLFIDDADAAAVSIDAGPAVLPERPNWVGWGDGTMEGRSEVLIDRFSYGYSVPPPG